MTQSHAQVKKLALYHYDSCPYCAKTRQVINDYDLKIEYKKYST